MKVLYFCEGFTDIRFVVGLSEICDLTMAVPAWEFEVSGLADRIAESGASLEVDAIHGRRPAFQARSFLYLLRNIRKYDVVLSQEMVRGSLNATVAGMLMGVPVVTYLGVSPIEYYRCRRERRQIGRLKAMAGEAFIRFAMNVSGRLATTALGMGPYLKDIAGAVSPRAAVGCYYGIDTAIFKPVSREQRQILRRRHQLPEDQFVIFFSSRISHEKDPETVLQAAAKARTEGLDVVLLNLGGGYKDFLNVGAGLGLTDVKEWIIGRPAVHPVQDLCEYFQAADVVIQSSLAEGAAFSTLEALAAGTPVIATDIGGMAVQLKGYAQLTPRRDVDAMANAIWWVARNPAEAREQAMRGREYVHENWRREKAFGDLKKVLELAGSRLRAPGFRPGAWSLKPEANLRSAIARGHYARKQLLSRDALVAWSHARRFDTAVSLAREFAGKCILDYGCGDGTFLALTMLTPEAPALAVGAELFQRHIDDCRRRYRDEPRLQFVSVEDIDSVEHRGRYDAVFCMEVLEHVVDWEPELARLARLLAPGGKLIISVPVETGLPLIVKQTVRRIAGWRGIGHYPGTASYSLAELASSVFAGSRQHLRRSVLDNGSGPFHDHKGFNWRVLRERLNKQFVIDRHLASPFPWLGPRLSTQVWFVARLRD